MSKELFFSNLKKITAITEKQEDLFERYYHWLVEENQKINLFSRKMDVEKIWTIHFLDSLLSLPHVEFAGKNILDFGTGGGLPGIPLAIMFPSAHITLLDSKKKKIHSLEECVDTLGISNCEGFAERIEDFVEIMPESFDMVVSRSVRMNTVLKKALFGLLRPKGEIVLYKGPHYEDTECFKKRSVIDVSHDLIGERKVVHIKK